MYQLNQSPAISMIHLCQLCFSLGFHFLFLCLFSLLFLFISMAVFLLSSGPLVTGVGLFHVYSTPSSPTWTSRFPLFGSWHFLTWPHFSPLSLPLLVSSVSFLVHLFYNPLLFLYLIFLTFTIPTQGTPFVKLLEVISVSLDFLDLPQYLRYAKVHSEGGACQKEGREE